MRRLKYSINVTVDGCGDHALFDPGPDVHAHAADGIASADAIVLGRRTYDLMEDGWRNADSSADMPAWVSGFRDTINGAKKFLASRRPPSDDWNTEWLRGDVCAAVRALKDEPGGHLATGGIHLPRTLAAAGLIDDFEFVVHPKIAGHGPWTFTGLPSSVQLRPVDRIEFENGVVALRYERMR